MPNVSLADIKSPEDLKGLSIAQLESLAQQIRDQLCRLIETRSVHFASNMGVVELTLALHTVFDFTKDRLVWDVGHQTYPHKMVTGRFEKMSGIRTKGGLMGYPNPEESPFDLFMTGHAGVSVSTALGLFLGDELMRPEEGRKAVAVVG
ncbi:MAG: 1-deoxy-D-xylulose-5-phosphate synthase, partial [Thermoguttaceae bacterium]|nr:1-deoxy-D-xylulose-5-phosphate synthase [Thermoguttaceae bacterium]